MSITSTLGTAVGETATGPTVDAVAAATGVSAWMWLLLAFPAFGAVLLLIGGRRTNRWGPVVATLLPIASFGVAVAVFFQMWGRSADQRPVGIHLWDWVVVGNFQAPFNLQLDQLSMVFVLLITGVGSLIHIYSLGYMKHDPDKRKFFGYMNLFVTAMLLLVMADNYLLLYVGWEGVGLASYLLVGFWQYKPSAAVAAKKAFVVNRVGDLGLSVAIMLMFVTFGSVTFPGVAAAASEASGSVLTWIGLLLLLAACGKSAQLPLQSWLLDAMEGPTPVSALIHAATMVTAGVYLIVRSNFIFDLSADARTAVWIIGALTLLAGAIIGCAKDDIKKALAGSTMSQIGYMVLAAGLGPIGYVFAIFHLLMHGFFKADLFLGAGAVMHGMHEQLDMRRFGALRTVMVATWITFSCAWLSIMGVPPFSGFFSKDKIIEVAFGVGWLPGLAALLGALLTAFYMTRIWTMTFMGKARWTDNNEHPHDASASMLIPMGVLALLAVFAGAVLAYGDAFVNWLTPVTGFAEAHPPINSHIIEAAIMVCVAVGAVAAYLQYRRDVPIRPPQHVTPLTVAARRDLYGDAFNEAVFMRPGQWLTRLLVFTDNRGIDGLVNGLAALLGGTSSRIRRWQTGFVRSYALTMVAGSAIVIAVVLLVRM